MATKLKNLKISKVDFVDEGANPDAHIRLFKRKDNDSGTGEAENNNGGVLQKIFSFIGKAAGMEQKEIDNAIDEIKKGDSVSFAENFQTLRNRKVADEIWDICYALQSSLCSIMNDDLDSTSAENAMQESLEEFQTVIKDCIGKWAGGNTADIISKNEDISEADLELMKSMADRLNETINKASISKATDGDNENEPKGEVEMKIDKSKLTEAERAFLDSIEKRYGTEEQEGAAAVEETPPTSGVEKNNSPQPEEKNTGVEKNNTPTPEPNPSKDNDIYKGLNPAVKAEIEALKKFREEALDRELHEIAKKYTVIGKKEDELVPLLKSLRAAGGAAYNDMIALMDQTVEAVEKSGLFSEVGKNGHGSSEGGAWAEAETKAIELMKSKSGITKAQALDEIFIQNPELAERCEKEE